MKILLVGEFSNVHWTLAEGLREIGHEVTVVSDGDHWKGYQADILIQRKSLGIMGTLRYLVGIFANLPRLRGYDVVQLINPIFFDLKAERLTWLYNYLRRHNKQLFLGAFGVDYYWVKTGLDCTTFRYGDFNLGKQERFSELNETWKRDWLTGKKGELSRRLADDCDGIITGLYEYDACYRPYFPQKTCFIPFPINRAKVTTINRPQLQGEIPAKVRFFIGMQRMRSAYKGTDIMHKALTQVVKNHPKVCEMVKVESVPYAQYVDLMNECDALLDQLYSYTPAMNGLLAMAKGLILVGGGEPENYEILGEKRLRPIINVEPNEESVYRQLEQLVLHRERVPQLCQDSLAYIAQHHDHVKVAQRYLDFWMR